MTGRVAVRLPRGRGRWRRGCARGATVAPDGPDAPAARAPDRVPRVARVLALAHHWQGLIRAGVVRNQAELARLVGVSRARVTQVMDTLRLAPDIQEDLLLRDGWMQDGGQLQRHVRTIATQPLWKDQRRALAAAEARDLGSLPLRSAHGSQ